MKFSCKIPQNTCYLQTECDRKIFIGKPLNFTALYLRCIVLIICRSLVVQIENFTMDFL